MTKQIFFGILFFALSVMALASAVYVYSQNTEDYQNIPVVSSIGRNLAGTDEQETLPKDDYFSILLLGVGGEGHDGGDLTDTIMIAQIDNTQKRIQLVSLPRDFLVFDEQGIYKKINSVYSFAVDEGLSEQEAIGELSKEVTKITGIPIDHYARVDFEGFKRMVDAVGGIEIEVTEPIDDPYYPGPNYSYDPFVLEAGTQQMNGEIALKYARTRYTSENGDFDRAGRQQQVVSKIKDEILSLNPVWDIRTIVSLINIFGQTVDSDLSIARMKELYDTYNDIDTYELDSVVVGEDLLRGSLEEGYRMFGRSRGYVLVPRAGDENYLQTREEVRNADSIDEYREEHYDIFITQPHRLTIISEYSPEYLKSLQELLVSKGFRVTLTQAQDEMTYSQNTLYLPPKDLPINEEGVRQVPAEERYLEREFAAVRRVDENTESMTLYLANLPEWLQKYFSEEL
jgi:LCP family protein required for cell wall assembly